MGLHVLHVFTYDRSALGEDGPAHQLVEQLAGHGMTLVIGPRQSREL
jgi:transketolase